MGHCPCAFPACLLALPVCGRKVIFKVPLYSCLSVLFPSSIQTLFATGNHVLLPLEKPQLRVTSTTGKGENGFRSPETFLWSVPTPNILPLLTHPHPPRSLFHTAGTTWRKKWDQIQDEWWEDSSYISFLPYLIPVLLCMGVKSGWQQCPLPPSPWFLCFLGREMKAARKPGIREQCSQPSSYHVPGTQISQFLPPPFNLGFP